MGRRQQERIDQLSEQILDLAVKNELRRFLEFLRAEVGNNEFQRLIREYPAWQRQQEQLARRGITTTPRR